MQREEWIVPSVEKVSSWWKGLTKHIFMEALGLTLKREIPTNIVEMQMNSGNATSDERTNDVNEHPGPVHPLEVVRCGQGNGKNI